MPEESPVPGTEMKLRPELMLAVCRALNFDPGEFARRHAREFTRCYLRADKMLSYAGDVIAAYLGCRVNECLSKAEYALLSYVEYAGRKEANQKRGRKPSLFAVRGPRPHFASSRRASR